MFSTSRIAHDFSHAANDYNDNASLQQRVLGRLIQKAETLTERMHVLDAGCGTGRLARLLTRQRIAQLDIAHGMCKSALRVAPVACGTVEQLPFADATFDAVFSSLVLQWTVSPMQALAEMKRVLKPAGLLAVSTLGEGTLHELKESFAQIDDFPHVSEFAGLAAPYEAETITEYFPDLRSLMQSLKIIGAGNKMALRRRSLMTQRQMQSVEDYYRKNYGQANGLPVTWNIHYSMLTA